MTVIPRIGFAQQRLAALGDTCTVTPHPSTGRAAFTVPCAVLTPSLKLGHGYGHEGGGPTTLSRRVTKSIIFNNTVVVDSGDNIHWNEKNVDFISGQLPVPSSLDPYIMVNATEVGYGPPG